MLRYLAALGFRIRANLDLIISLTLAAIIIYLLSLAATSGPNSGATFADDSSVGTITWSSTGNAASSNNTYATASLNDFEVSHYLKATNFSFAIPIGSTINGITVEVEKNAAKASRIKDNQVKIIKGGTIGATNKADTTNFWGTADAYSSYGGASDTWGESWTAADINSTDFGVAFAAIKDASAGTAIVASIDHIRITVSYTPPNSAPNAPTLVSPANGSTTSDNTPTLSANYSDVDTGDTGTTNYRIATSAANCLAGTVVASGTSSATASNNQNTTWTPLSSIGSDATYYWCAQNDDGVLTSAWTSMGNFILDSAGPTVTEVTPVTTPTNDTTPNYTFNTTEAGTITYGGDCSSATTAAVSGNNTVTFNALSSGPHTNCTIQVTDAGSNLSNTLNVTAFTIDTTAPTLTQVTPVTTPTNDNTPSYTFNTTEAGTIAYGGGCSGATTSASVGNNTIDFGPLSDNTYNCTLTVTDTAGNTSSNLNVTAFTIDTALPVLAQVTPVPSLTNDNTPNYTFSSTEAGNITYGGDCSSATTVASSGNNTVTFNTLADGAHSNCTVKVTDAAGNQSLTLNVSAFTVDTTPPTLAEVTPVPVTTNDNTPNYTFSSTEAGNITYGGDCSSATTSASIGNNTVTFNTLADGLHNNCTINVTDTATNLSSTLNVSAFTVDTTPPPGPTIAEVTPVPNPTNDTTPNYTFSSTDSGTISYGGDCSSVTTAAVAGNNTITFNTLAEGVHNNCTIQVTDALLNPGNLLNVTQFTIDTTAPTVTEVTPVTSPTNDNTPSYTFNTTEAGNITYGGSCSSATTVAISGNNTVTFNALLDGTYSNCTVSVTDNAGNTSSASNVSTFTIDTAAPVISEVTAVPTPGSNATPSYTFNSSEAGSITYGGDCSSATTLAVSGLNTVVFNSLADGIHNNCTITVTDATLNLSNLLNVSAFVIDTVVPSTVTDLTALSPTTTSIALAWTAPGNDGPVGTATSYEIRYSTSPINIGNFGSATLAAGIPLPQVAGSAENMIVGGLASGTTYYFALISQDGAGNNSALSNVASETTVAAPVIVPPVVVVPEPTPVGVGAVGGIGAGSCSGPQCSSNLKSINFQSQNTGSNSQKNNPLNCRRNQNTPITFADIAGDANRLYIEDMFRKCIVDGKSEDKFDPSGAITRAEFLKVVLNYFNLGTSTYQNTYSDVSKDDWFAKYVAKAVELKLISMGSNFNPNNNITRVEALKILLLAKGVPNLEGYHANYQDADETDWFYHYAAYAHANGLLEVKVLTSSQKGQIRQFFSFPTTMKAGDRGDKVKELKNALYQLGLYNDNKSDNFDLALTRALTKFQVAHRLRASGELDEQTRLALLNEEVIIKKVSYFIPQKPLTRSELTRLLYRLGR